MKSSLICICSVALSVAGCARVTHTPVPYSPIPVGNEESSAAARRKNAESDKAVAGIRYYQASPYLLVYSDGKGGIGWKVYYLPDQTLKVAAHPFNFIAKVSANLSFSKGVLTESAEEADTTAVPKAILAAAEKLASALVADVPPTDRKLLPPRLYKLIISGDTISLAGGVADTSIVVTVKPK